MPYITEELRKSWKKTLNPLLNKIQLEESSVGELNYLITKIILAKEPQTYTEYNALVGVLSSVKTEFERRGVAIYEDEKIKENGDVYDNRRTA